MRAEPVRDIDKGKRFSARLRVFRIGLHSPEHQHEAVALQTNKHVGTRVAGGATNLIDVDRAVAGANEHRRLTTTIPAEGRDTARQFVVALAGEDGVDDERLEPCIPEPAGLGRSGVHVSGREGDVA